MISLKKVLRVGVPAAVLALGVTVYAQARSTDCAHPTMFAKVMQATGMAKITPCELLDLGNGAICFDPGHHCNIGNGPGKCTNVPDAVTGNLSCQCVK